MTRNRGEERTFSGQAAEVSTLRSESVQRPPRLLSHFSCYSCAQLCASSRRLVDGDHPASPCSLTFSNQTENRQTCEKLLAQRLRVDDSLWLGSRLLTPLLFFPTLSLPLASLVISLTSLLHHRTRSEQGQGGTKKGYTRSSRFLSINTISLLSDNHASLNRAGARPAFLLLPLTGPGPDVTPSQTLFSPWTQLRRSL